MSIAVVLVFLLIAIAGIAVLSSRLNVPSAILMVLGGVVLALIPGLPRIRLEPDVVLLLVLPPVIYSSAVAMSWRDFRFNLRPISLLAVGCVVFTSAAIAAATHWLLGFSWQVGFLLGAIVSPPDAVAPLSIARRMLLPRRIVVILEGEGLANDATALILYRFAVAAAAGGLFSFDRALGTFLAIVAGELVWGVVVGWAMLRLRRWVEDPRVEILLSLLTPFLAYWPPQHLGGSGVLATVCTGLYISWNGFRLISAATRLQGIFFWDFFIYVIEGVVFLLTGLQARALMSGMKGLPLTQLLIHAGVVCGVVILTRFIWMYPATYLPRWLFPAIARRDPSPPWQWPFVLAFTGVRGIVSLAAALAIPLTTDAGAPFPNRDLVLFLSFAVVLVTLVGQGLSLPLVIRWLGLADAGGLERAREREEELQVRRHAIAAALKRLEAVCKQERLAAEILTRFQNRLRDRLTQTEWRADPDPQMVSKVSVEDELELRLIGVERDLINDLYCSGDIKDEARRRIERELDLREAAVENLRREPTSE